MVGGALAERDDVCYDDMDERNAAAAADSLDGAAGEKDGEILSGTAEKSANCEESQGNLKDQAATEYVRKIGQKGLDDAGGKKVGGASPEGVGGSTVKRLSYNLD